MDPNTQTGGDAGTQAQAPWHEGIITKGGDGVEALADFATWKDRAPEPLRKFITDNMTAARAKTEGMFKVPGADAKPEEWEPVWKALGRPDTPDGYGFAKPEKLPDGVDWNDDFAKGFAAFAHSVGMPKTQAEQLIAWHTEQMGAQAAAMKEAGVKMVEAERAELNKAFGPKLAEVAAAAQQAAVKAGRPAQLFDPAAGEFLGVPALQVVAGLLSQIETFTKEASFGGPGTTPGTSGGYDYAEQVISGKHADSDAYWKGDAEVNRRVLEGIKAAPKRAA